MISPFWRRHVGTIDPERFRATPAYLCTDGYDHRKVFDWIFAHDNRRLFGALKALGDEDGAFGAEIIRYRGCALSRDRLDTAIELWLLGEWLGGEKIGRVLDIGAGYGRLLSALHFVWRGVEALGIDPVRESREAARKYLAHPGTRASILSPADLDTVEDILDAPARFDLALNVHVWSECTLGEVLRWLGWLYDRRVPRIFVVPHTHPNRAPWENLGTWDEKDGGGGGAQYGAHLEAMGYELAHEFAGAGCPDGVDRYLFTHPEFLDT